MGLKLKGKIVEWNQNKGFGFIRSNSDSKGIFIHISDFKNRQYKPRLGDIIVYEVAYERNNKKKAINAIYEGDLPSSNINYKKISKIKRKFYFMVLIILFFFTLFLDKKEIENNKNINKIDNYTLVTSLNSSNISVLDFNDSMIETKIQEEINDTDDLSFIVKGAAERYNKDNHKMITSLPASLQKISERYNKDSHKIRKTRKISKRYTCDGRHYCSQMHSCKEAIFFLKYCPNPKMDGDRDGIPCEKQWCH